MAYKHGGTGLILILGRLAYEEKEVFGWSFGYTDARFLKSYSILFFIDSLFFRRRCHGSAGG
jgi:hypothetical protein